MPIVTKVWFAKLNWFDWRLGIEDWQLNFESSSCMKCLSVFNFLPLSISFWFLVLVVCFENKIAINHRRNLCLLCRQKMSKCTATAFAYCIDWLSLALRCLTLCASFHSASTACGSYAVFMNSAKLNARLPHIQRPN